MARSAPKRRKPPQQRPASTVAREARSPLRPAPPPAQEGFLADVDDDDWDDGAPADEQEAGAPLSSGRVRAVTARRAQVPFLLHDVIKAKHAAAVAERDLDKRVRKARAAGASWEDIGVATGMSRQGAAKRFG